MRVKVLTAEFCVLCVLITWPITMEHNAELEPKAKKGLDDVTRHCNTHRNGAVIDDPENVLFPSKAKSKKIKKAEKKRKIGKAIWQMLMLLLMAAWLTSRHKIGSKRCLKLMTWPGLLWALIKIQLHSESLS